MANGELLMANDGEASEAGGSWGFSGSDSPFFWLESGICPMAGGSVHDLTGNESGVWPECGRGAGEAA